MIAFLSVRSRWILRSLFMLLTAVTLNLTPSLATAAPPVRPPPPRGVVTLPGSVQNQSRTAPRANKVTVGMMVVHATDAHSNVDQRLGSLTRYLSHMRFTGYDLLETRSVQLSRGGSETFSIQGGRKAPGHDSLGQPERHIHRRWAEVQPGDTCPPPDR